MCSALECITFEEKKVITAERMQNIYSRAFYQKVACFAWINQQVLLLSSKLQGFLCKKKKKYIVFNQNALTTFFFSKHNWPLYEMGFFFYPSSVKRQKLERKNVLFPTIALSEIAFCFYTNAKCINILILTLISFFFVKCTSVCSIPVWFRYLLQISAVGKSSLSASFIQNNEVVRQMDLC